jgi:hypothetical protein
MTINFAWTYPELEVAPAAGELENVVRVVHWRLRAEDDRGAAEIYGAAALPAPNPDDFRDFDNLAAPDIAAWLDPLLDVPALKAQLATALAEQASPAVIVLPAPWA